MNQHSYEFHRKYAKRLAQHYFTILAESAGLKVDSDMHAEIDDMVDSIIQAGAALAADYIEEFEAEQEQLDLRDLR